MEFAETAAATTSVRRGTETFAPSPSAIASVIAVDSTALPADELTATTAFSATATAIPAATDRVRLATMEFVETSAATTAVRRGTETLTPSPTAIASVIAVDATTTPSTTESATPVPAAADGSQLATAKLATKVADTTSARRDVEMLTLSPSATTSVTAVDSTALPADELTAEPSTAGSATAIPAATDGSRKLATADVATTVAATTSSRRETETLTPSPSATASVIPVDSTALTG